MAPFLLWGEALTRRCRLKKIEEVTMTTKWVVASASFVLLVMGFSLAFLVVLKGSGSDQELGSEAAMAQAASGDGTSEGIKVHGHWVLDH